MRQTLAVAIVFFLAVTTASAAVFEPVSDAQLVESAELIVLADVTGRSSRMLDSGAIVTDVTLSIRDVLKGTAGAEIVVTEYGGLVGDRGMMVTGSADYREGARVLAFLERGGAGAWRTSTMALGLFHREQRSGTDVFVRDGHSVEVDDADAFTPRLADRFMQFVRATTKGEPAIDAQVAPMMFRGDNPVVQGTAAASYALAHDGMPVRRPFNPGGTVNYHVNEAGGISGGNSAEAAEEGLDVWTDHADSFITLNLAGPSFANTVGTLDGENTIVFGETPPNVGMCTSSAIACGVFWVAGTHEFDGTDFRTIVEGDVVIRDGTYSQNTLDSLAAHELGHSIGLRHSNQGTPGTTNALMNSSVPQTGATLRQWDMDAMAEMYGPGIPCVPITGVTITGGGEVTEGQMKTLRAVVSPSNANGTKVYQWFRGAAGDMSQPVGSNSDTFETPPVTSQMSFWVKVTATKDGDPCGQASSPAVTVQPREAPGCNPVVINLQPASSTVQPGTSVTLSVAATGTGPISYHWFEGAVGNTTKPVGFNTSTFTTPPLSVTTSYWVRVSNTCEGGSSANSIQATITVTTPQTCVPPTVTSFTSTASISVGGTASLTVSASGTAPLTYQWFVGDLGDVTTPIVGATGPMLVVGPFETPGTRRYWVRVGGCNQSFIGVGPAIVDVGCPAPQAPVIMIPPLVNESRDDFMVRWELPSTQVGDFTFEVQRSTDLAFVNPPPVTVTVDGDDHLLVQTAGLAKNVRHYMRVRAVSKCNQAASAYSAAGSFVIQSNPTPDIGPNGGVLPSLSGPHDSNEPVTQEFRLTTDSDASAPSIAATETFTITSDQPWVVVEPSHGTIPPQGLDLTLTVNPAGLPVGSSSATLTIVRDTATSAGSVRTHATTSVNVPLSFGKVTPVAPVPRDASTAEGTLIIPAVAHAEGVGARFQSDVRIANTSGETITYDVSFTPSGTNGLAGGKKTTIDVEPLTTFALDDIVQIWFGAGLAGEIGSGTIEIRPLRTASGGTPSLAATVASSRLFAIGSNGTLGQFIPALTPQRFIANSTLDPLAKISLQQVAQSAAFRTNIGFVEGSGNPVSVLVKALDGNNALVGEKALSFAPYEHRQFSFGDLFPGKVLADGRIEVTTTSTSGKATAYASVLDNKTTDPLMVFPEQAGRFSSTRYVVPGVAELTAASNFHTDMRIFNPTNAPVSATLDYYPQSGDATPRPAPVTMTIAANQTKAIDNVLPELWDLTATGGQVAITTSNPAALVATARTYSRNSEGGTFGQFIPAVTPADAVGLGERSLNVLQLEDSPSFRSNLGIFEVSGAPALVEVTAFPPDGKITPVIHIPLAANTFMQLPRILTSMGLPDGYNGRISVKVVDGSGRVSAYGSVVDNRTEDPTYVPAQ